MTWRARFERRRFVSAGAVLGNGFRTWLRGLPVALMVVLLTGALPVLVAARMYDPFVSDSETPVNMAVTAYTNTTVATWATAFVVFFRSYGFQKDGALVGVVTLAVCYAATGLLAGLLYSRRTAGTWRGTSVAAFVRLLAFAVLTTLVLVPAKMAMIGMAGGFFLFGPYLFLAVTIPEAWLVSRYWLVIPILAIERVPIGTAFRRSLRLTRGSGFAVFAIVAVLAVLTFLVLVVLGMAFEGVLDDAYGFGLTGLVMTTIQGAMLAEGYRHLRELREGPDEHAMAAVFE